MSWCRWGSKCTWTTPPLSDDTGCPEGLCPGSDLYIYEADHGLVCCGCRLSEDGDDYVCDTADGMRDHIELHVAAGHHVRASLRHGAKREPGLCPQMVR